MELLDALDRAADGFSRRLQAAPDEAWSNPTPCSEWDVRALVAHVIGGNRLAAGILRGAHHEEVLRELQALGVVTAGDVVAEYEQSAAEQRAAFREEGALDRSVNHVIGDIPSGMLLGFRVSDLAIHSWDLARGLGVDDTLDPDVLEVVLRFAEPLGAGLKASGRFGEGASGALPEGASLQERVLDLHGRRP
jgi:uncharacterized protein (TIGR03086 family)